MSNQKLADALRALIAANEQQENTDYLAARDMAMDAAREALACADERDAAIAELIEAASAGDPDSFGQILFYEQEGERLTAAVARVKGSVA